MELPGVTHFLDQPVRLREMKREREVPFRSQAGFLGLWGKLGKGEGTLKLFWEFIFFWLLLLNIYFFIWLWWVLVAACGIINLCCSVRTLCCGMWNLVP